MQYDSGEVLQGLNENWTFLGANMLEWASGLVVFLMISAFSTTPARAMPFMLGGWVLTTTTLASLRSMFPDEERGVRNAMLTAAGFPPPGIPAPSALQPYWSAAPVRILSEESNFARLGIDQLLPSFERDLLPDEFEELLR